MPSSTGVVKRVARPLRAESTGGERWTEIGPSHGWLPRIDFGELWAYRELVRALAVRDLKLRYKQTFFGVAWALIQPLAAAAIFTVVFGRLAHLPSEGVAYVVFVYAGLCVWTYVSSAVGAAAESLIENNKLVTTVYFPRLLAPAAAVVPGLVDLAVSLCILAVLMAIHRVTPGWQLATLPLWVMAAVGVAFGVGVLLCGLNVRYRDVRYTFAFLLQIWLFASPVVFAGSLVHGGWRYLFAANPLVGVLDGFRWSVLGTATVSFADCVSFVAGALLVCAGVLHFARVERQIADRI